MAHVFVLPADAQLVRLPPHAGAPPRRYAVTADRLYELTAVDGHGSLLIEPAAARASARVVVATPTPGYALLLDTLASHADKFLAASDVVSFATAAVPALAAVPEAVLVRGLPAVCDTVDGGAEPCFRLSTDRLVAHVRACAARAAACLPPPLAARAADLTAPPLAAPPDVVDAAAAAAPAARLRLALAAAVRPLPPALAATVTAAAAPDFAALDAVLTSLAALKAPVLAAANPNAPKAAKKTAARKSAGVRKPARPAGQRSLKAFFG
ncbi:ribonuclease H2, subunit B [Dipodascopsis tothii]|uniref:ribonuclease H2, subunit B n=1 Tax=Dipodascopsis tothii TaxID=44089 RepID=UPI0034CF23C3